MAVNNKVMNKNGLVGEGVKFERIRRITGYLTGDESRWCNSKRCELHDRVTHKMHH